MLVAIRAGYSSCSIMIITFFAGEMVWRERNLRWTASSTRCRCRHGCRCWRSSAPSGPPSSVFIAAGMVALMGFQLFRATRTSSRPLRSGPGRRGRAVPPDRGARALLPGRRKPEVRRLPADGPVPRQRGVLAALHFDHYLYRYRRSARRALFGHERLGPLRRRRSSGSTCTGRFGRRRPACAWPTLALGARRYDRSWRSAVARRTARLRGPALALVLLLAGRLRRDGAFIFYNTNVLNEYVPVGRGGTASGRVREAVQPVSRTCRSRGSCRSGPTWTSFRESAAPTSAAPIGSRIGRRRRSRRCTSASPRVKIRRARVCRRIESCSKTGGSATRSTAAPRRSRPARRSTLGFDLEIANPGFVNNDADNAVVDNGTFFHSRHFPSFGYQDYRELARSRRSDAGRGCRRSMRMAKIDDLQRARDATTSRATPTGSTSRPPSAPTPTRSRSRPATCSGSGPRADAATSTTRWTRRSRSSSPSCPRATRCARRWHGRRHRGLPPPGRTSTTSTG